MRSFLCFIVLFTRVVHFDGKNLPPTTDDIFSAYYDYENGQEEDFSWISFDTTQTIFKSAFSAETSSSHSVKATGIDDGVVSGILRTENGLQKHVTTTEYTLLFSPPTRSIIKTNHKIGIPRYPTQLNPSEMGRKLDKSMESLITPLKSTETSIEKTLIATTVNPKYSTDTEKKQLEVATDSSVLTTPPVTATTRDEKTFPSSTVSLQSTTSSAAEISSSLSSAELSGDGKLISTETKTAKEPNTSALNLWKYITTPYTEIILYTIIALGGSLVLALLVVFFFLMTKQIK